MSGRHNERGFALISVLWVVMLLAVIATSVLQFSRLHSEIGHSVFERAKARSSAEAGIYLAILRLIDGTLNDVILAQNRTGYSVAYERRFGDVALSILIENERSRINLNQASEGYLRGLAQAVVGDNRQAGELADAILDYLDADSLRRANGAEDVDYGRAGLAHGAADGPFQTVNELRRVLGMRTEWFEEMRNAVTVFSATGQIDMAMARPLVVQAVTGSNSKEAERLVAERLKTFTKNEIPEIEIARIRVIAQTQSGSRFSRVAVVALSGDESAPYSILDWREGTGGLPSSDGDLTD